MDRILLIVSIATLGAALLAQLATFHHSKEERKFRAEEGSRDRLFPERMSKYPKLVRGLRKIYLMIDNLPPSSAPIEEKTQAANKIFEEHEGLSDLSDYVIFLASTEELRDEISFINFFLASRHGLRHSSSFSPEQYSELSDKLAKMMRKVEDMMRKELGIIERSHFLPHKRKGLGAFLGYLKTKMGGKRPPRG